MRGSAQPVSGRPKPAALRAAWQGNLRSPVHPLNQEAALPLFGSPQSHNILSPILLRADKSGPQRAVLAGPLEGEERPLLCATWLLRCEVTA